MDRPLIFTTKGNLPVDELVYNARWELNADHIKFVETYALDGEVVKENAHVCVIKGEFALPQTTPLS